jgi:DnaK suppressor protein
LEASWRAIPVPLLASGPKDLHGIGVLSVDEQIELEIQARAELELLRAEANNEEVDPQAVAVDVAIGRLSRLDSMQMEEVRKAATRLRNLRIHELQESLRRMDEGGYGICEGCGEWIAYARLEQRPEANLCGDCAR